MSSRSRLVLVGLLALLFAILEGVRVPETKPALDAVPLRSPSAPAPASAPVIPAPRGHARVLHVIDGDTIILVGGTRVRYIGVDTPELSDGRLRAVAQDASDANRRLVEGSEVRLETDLQALDRYGRTLAYVWVGKTMINEVLLREGFARLLTIPPNVRYVGRLRSAAAAGAALRSERLKGLPVPDNSVAGASAFRGQECPSDLPIKGNITERGEKIFHAPGGAFYAATRPEECFAAPEAAERAGYRASRR